MRSRRSANRIGRNSGKQSPQAGGDARSHRVLAGRVTIWPL
jgi:hypothetical protein